MEKPALGTAPSNLAIISRYILNPEIFWFLEKQVKSVGGEIQLTDGLEYLNQIQIVFAYQFEGSQYDVGEKFGFVKTPIEFALQHEDIKKEIMEYLECLVSFDLSRVRRFIFLEASIEIRTNILA